MSLDSGEEEGGGAAAGAGDAEKPESGKAAAPRAIVAYDQLDGFVERDDEYDGFLRKPGADDGASADAE